MLLQYQLVGRLGLIFSVCALLTACDGGQISESGGGPGDPRVGNDGSGNPSNPGVDGEDSPLVCPGASADVSASNGWRSSQAPQPASEELRFEFKARPTAEDLDGLVAVGAQNIDTFSDAAILVRFAEDGFVDARNGAIYDSDVSYPYDPGVWYNVIVTADIVTKTYDVEIGSCGESPKTLIQDASFRDDASTSDQLSGWAVWSSQSAALDVSTPAWIASVEGCLPASCQTLGHVCGQPNDGCGGVLSCGACGSGLICSSGVCIDESTPPPPCQPASCQTLGAECGVQGDGCGGTVNCGSCTGGDICIVGVCSDPATALEPENTQGDSWETIYENCTGDDYPSGYRPPLFVRPTMQNTGVNCPDKASGCPADATLTPLGTNDITSPGIYENFTVTGKLNIEANNVTIRNFEVLCNAPGGAGIEVVRGFTGATLEYGTIKRAPGADSCGWNLWPMGGETLVRHVHFDQCGQDCIQSTQVPGPTLVARSLFTRVGDNGGYGSSAHADTWQYYDNLTSEHACWLGSRVVPSYCPNFYKNSNVTQSGWDVGPGKWYLYNNWFDASTNVMIAGDAGVVRNNKFGNFISSGKYWFPSIIDMGGNTYECDGSALTDGQNNSVQSTCPWGFDNDPVTGWDGESECGADNSEPCDGQGNPIACTGTVDSQPIDPTEFCTSNGSGCVVTP